MTEMTNSIPANDRKVVFLLLAKALKVNDFFMVNEDLVVIMYECSDILLFYANIIIFFIGWEDFLIFDNF